MPPRAAIQFLVPPARADRQAPDRDGRRIDPLTRSGAGGNASAAMISDTRNQLEDLARRAENLGRHL
ncbi:MAG: hypothetical protein JWM10_591 [Myxococcaceae bacterium]|nr:hypothetical protein [Myxococcaceae bacterium]